MGAPLAARQGSGGRREHDGLQKPRPRGCAMTRVFSGGEWDFAKTQMLVSIRHPTSTRHSSGRRRRGAGGARILTPRHPPTINGSPPARRVRLPRQPRAACDGGSFPSHRAMAAEARRPPRGGTKSGSSLLSRPKTTRTAPPASVDKRGPGFPVSRITFSLTSHICGGFQGSLMPVAHSTQEPALLTSHAVAAPSPPQARGFANICEGTAPATRVALSPARWTRVSRT